MTGDSVITIMKYVDEAYCKKKQDLISKLVHLRDNYNEQYQRKVQLDVNLTKIEREISENENSIEAKKYFISAIKSEISNRRNLLKEMKQKIVDAQTFSSEIKNIHSILNTLDAVYHDEKIESEVLELEEDDEIFNLEYNESIEELENFQNHFFENMETSNEISTPF